MFCVENSCRTKVHLQIFVIYSWVQTAGFSILYLILGMIVAGILFGVPMGLCIVVYPFFEKYIHR